MSIIKSIKQTDFTTIITTKSGIVRVYKFNTIEENNKFYHSHMQKCRVHEVAIFTDIEDIISIIKVTNVN